MQNKKPVYFIITILASVFFLPFIGHYHLFDWDEINFAESAREMLVTGNYSQVQIGFEPFWEKPPLFIWMQAFCMKLFGINEFAARLPNALCGIATLNILYYIGNRIRNHFTALFWVLAYGCSLAPALYFRSGIIDPVFNLFIFLVVYHLFRAESGKAEKMNIRVHMLLAGAFSGLALLFKGPVALLIIGIIYLFRLVLNYKNAWTGWLNAFVAFVGLALISAIWIVPEWMQNGSWFFTEFLKYQVLLFQGQMAWHNQPWFYHIIVLLILCFPASVLGLSLLIKGTNVSGEEKIWAQYMRSLFWIVLIIFSLSSTKIIHYSSLCWFPLSWFAGTAIYRWHTNRGKIQNWIKIPSAIVILLLGFGIIAGSLILSNASLSVQFTPSDPVLKSITSAHKWLGWEWIIGALFLVLGLYWLFASKPSNGLHPAWIFILTGVFSVALSVFILPSAEQSFQGAYIKEIRRLSKQPVYFDIWGFKSYAHFFYGNITPDEMYGDWSSENTVVYAKYPNPNATARQFWLMDKAVNKPVYIFTRIDFKPDWYFNDKFKAVKDLGAYKLWQRVNPQKPDIRLQN